MRLLIISLMEGEPWGGSEELWYRVAVHAHAKGDTVNVCVRKWSLVPDKLLQLEHKGVKLIYRNYGILLKPRQAYGISIAGSVFNTIRKTFKISRLNFLTYDRYDHVLISFGGAYDLLLHRDLFSRLMQEKVPYSIIQQHNAENVYLDNGKRKYARSVYSNAAQLYFVSKRNLETTCRNLVAKLDHARVISNPANMDEYEFKIPYNREGPISFACVARLDTGIKNQDMLLECVSRPEWRSRDFIINIYGRGDGEDYLKELIEFYRLESKVNLCGHVRDVKEIWRNNHILVLPSSSEGSPLSVIEAMYCARPVIVTDVGGNSELVDGSCGFLIPGITVDGINEALNKVWDKRHDWESMGAAAYQRIVKIHDRNSHEYIYETIKKNEEKKRRRDDNN